MDTIFVFIDAATSPQAGIAIGAFICLEQQQINELDQFTIEILSKHLANKVSYKKYTSNKSTWSEITTAIHAFSSIRENTPSIRKVEIYTDCQSLCDLLGKRKEKLEKNNFMNRNGKVIQHAKLYKELYAIVENFEVQIIKVKGHNPKYRCLSWQERVFSVLDKFSRKKLRLIVRGALDAR